MKNGKLVVTETVLRANFAYPTGNSTKFSAISLQSAKQLKCAGT